MTADEEFAAWRRSYGYRAEKAGWTIWNDGFSWKLVKYVTTSGGPLSNSREVWVYVLKFANTQPQCRRAVEFIARWNPALFNNAMKTIPQPNPPDWLQLLIVTAELRR